MPFSSLKIAYLGQGAPTRQTSVSGKRPEHTRRRSQGSHGAARRKDHYKSCHGRGTRDRLHGVVENSDERERRVRFQCSVDVAGTEKHSKHHAKAETAVDPDSGHDSAWNSNGGILDLLSHLPKLASIQ